MRRLAAAIAVGATLVLIAGSCGGATHVTAPLQVATARVSGLELAYPTAFHIRPFSSCNRDVTGDTHGACIHGVVVASYALKSQPERRGFRKKGVAFELYRSPSDQGRANIALGDRSLALWPFSPNMRTQLIGATASPPEQYSAWVRVHGASYWAIAWVSTHATTGERHALARLIKSVHAVGVTPRQALPLPPPQVTHVLCGGSPGSPRMPSDTLAGSYGQICVQVSGSTCRVFTQKIGAPVSAIRERHFHLASHFCGYANRFLAEHPRGYVVEQRPSHLVLG